MGVAVTKCISSHLMTELLTWRNPQGKEENWITGPQEIESRWKHAGKVIVTEIGLAFLTLTATVETVAYTALVLVSLVLSPVTDRPYEFFATLLSSSSFTIVWSAVDMVLNLFTVNLMTRETFARYWAQQYNPTRIELLRFEDRLYITDFCQRQGVQGHENQPGPLLQPILTVGKTTQEMITLGARFIADEVLSEASNETKGLFKEMDPSMFMFILTKAVHIYVVGGRKEDELPGFFKPETQQLIRNLRQELNDGAIIGTLQELVADPERFEAGSEDQAVKAAFSKLRNIASGELQGSLFTTRCWNEAIQLVSVDENVV